MEPTVIIKSVLQGFVPVLMQYSLEEDKWTETTANTPIRSHREMACVDAEVWAMKDGHNIDLDR